MRSGKLLTRLIILAVGSLLLVSMLGVQAMSTALPEGKGIQQLPPGEARGRRPSYFWVWKYMWPNPPHPEITTGTWTMWGFGWGSGTEETLVELLEGLDMSFSIDGVEIENPLNYFTMENKGTYWALSFIYQHPPLRPGEYSWNVSLSGSTWPVTINGAFTVIQRGKH